MTDTAQPIVAAETDAFADAASAFKVALGQEEKPPVPRDESGRFASATPEDEQEPEPTPEQVDDDGQDDSEEAATETEEDEEAQPEAVPLPQSWSKDDEQLWTSLPAEAQAKIAEREAQRDQAVGRKFQEAATVRSTAEQRAAEAENSRMQYAVGLSQVIGLMAPQEPPLSMLDQTSGDYNPDGYHILSAQYRQSIDIIGQLDAERQDVLRAIQQDEQRKDLERLSPLNSETMAQAFVKEVPDIVNPEKQGQIVKDLQAYAINELGAPQEVFATPTTLFEWHVLWKAREYDRLQKVGATVRAEPAPKPKPQPPVRPGVTTPRSTVQKQQRDRDFARLKESGSIADGAAVFKHLFKG